MHAPFRPGGFQLWDLDSNCDGWMQPDDVERSDPSTTRSEERSLAERLLAKHMHEEHHSTLNVSVIEARGLGPRSGQSASCQP